MAIYREDFVDIELDNSGNIFRSFLNKTIGKTDNLENRFGVRVFRKGVAVALTGCTCLGFFTAPDGSNIVISGANAGTEGNSAWVQLPQDCYNYDGQFSLAIKLSDGTVTGTMRIIDGVVSNVGTDGAVAPTETVPTYQEVLAVYDQMLGMVQDGKIVQAKDIFAYGETPPSPYNDYNTLPLNEMVFLFGGTASHAPSTESCMVATFGVGYNRLSVYQFAFPMPIGLSDRIPNILHYRISSTGGNDWSPWLSIKNQDVFVRNVPEIGYNPGVTPDAPYNDADTYPFGTVVLSYRNRNVLHLPPRGDVFTIATFSGINTSVTAFQIAVDLYENAVFTRSNPNGTYGNWVQLVGSGSAAHADIIVNENDSLVEAVETAVEQGNTTVIVNGGTHNVLAEWGITDAKTDYGSGFDFYGMRLSNKVRIVGINGAKLTANYGGSVENVKTLFSIFNIMGDCEIVGVTLEGTNIRYCVHDDPENLLHSGTVPGFRVLYEDCRMEHKGSNSGTYSVPACIGAGTTQASEHVINRCVFKSPSGTNPVSYHNNGTALTGKVTMTNCALLNDGVFQLYALAETGSYIDVLINNNYMGGQIHLIPESTDRFNIIQFGNVTY